MKQAARSPESFYGLVARQTLGMDRKLGPLATSTARVEALPNVVRALRLSDERWVAIKFLSPAYSHRSDYRKRFERRSETPLVLMTQRRRLDAFLAEQAAAAGAVFRDGVTVEGLTVGPDGATLRLRLLTHLIPRHGRRGRKSRRVTRDCP